MHPEHRVPGIDFSTGSLGHGLSMGVGAALAARLERRRDESSCCSATRNARGIACGKPRCSRRIIACRTSQRSIDMNGQQALGHTRDVLDLSPMADRWRAFGWDAREWTATTSNSWSKRWRRSKSTRARHGSSSPRRCSAAAFHSWRNSSPGTTCRCPTSSSRWPWKRLRKLWHETLIRLGTGGNRSDGRSYRAAHRRPRIHGARAVRGAVSRSIRERRRRRAEHGRRGHRARGGRLRPVRATRSGRSRRFGRTR